MKKIISLLAVIALMAVLATAAFAADEVALVVDTVEGKAGEEVSVNISIVNNPGITSAEFNVIYDQENLELVSLKKVGGEDWLWDSNSTINIKKGKVALVADIPEDGDGNPVDGYVLNGDCVLVTAVFKIKETVAPGTYEVKINVETVADDYDEFISYDTEFKGAVVVLCTAHEWDGGVVKTAADCVNDGVMVYTCQLCGETKEEVIPATGHAWGEWETTVEPTEETEGEAKRVCANCGEVETKVLPKLAHEHKYEAVVTAPTCTEKGFTTYTCACGDTYVDDYVDALGHTMDEGVETLAPTCCEEGVMTFTCTVCGETETEAIPATGEHKIAYIDNEDGKTHRIVCENSGKVLTPEEAHKYGELVDDPENEGWKYQVCELCGYIHKENHKPTGDNGMIAVAAATLAMLGIAVVVSKKKEF